MPLFPDIGSLIANKAGFLAENEIVSREKLEAALRHQSSNHWNNNSPHRMTPATPADIPADLKAISDALFPEADIPISSASPDPRYNRKLIDVSWYRLGWQGAYNYGYGSGSSWGAVPENKFPLFLQISSNAYHEADKNALKPVLLVTADDAPSRTQPSTSATRPQSLQRMCSWCWSSLSS